MKLGRNPVVMRAAYFTPPQRRPFKTTDFVPMIDRRALFPLLFAGAAGLYGCAGGDEPGPGGHGEHAHAEEPEMLFISPMGEPFRAKPPAPYPVDVWFKGADKDGDGKLDLAEFQADAERFFHILDINKDGVIDHREVYYYEHRIVPEVLGPAYGALRGVGAPAKIWQADYQVAQLGGGAGGGIGGMGGPPVTDGTASKTPDGGRLGDHDAPLVGAAAYGLLADPEPVQGSDIRITGLITLADFKTRAQQRFDLLDNEHKGYLTLAGLPETEAEQSLPRRRGRRGPPRSA